MDSYVKFNSTLFHPETGKIITLEAFEAKYNDKLTGLNVKEVWTKLGGKVKKQAKRIEPTGE